MGVDVKMEENMEEVCAHEVKQYDRIYVAFDEERKNYQIARVKSISGSWPRAFDPEFFLFLHFYLEMENEKNNQCLIFQFHERVIRVICGGKLTKAAVN